MQWLSLASDLIGILGAFFALKAWLQSREVEKELEEAERVRNQRVNVVLKSDSHQITLPVAFRRAELARAEILGRIGMIPMKESGKRFELKFLHQPEFLERINQVLSNAGEATLVIDCTENEISQFKF